MYLEQANAADLESGLTCNLVSRLSKKNNNNNVGAYTKRV